jgi:hypothetical protein
MSPLSGQSRTCLQPDTYGLKPVTLQKPEFFRKLFGRFFLYCRGTRQHFHLNGFRPPQFSVRKKNRVCGFQ